MTDLNSMSKAALSAAMRSGMNGWGQVGGLPEHIRYMEPRPKRPGRKPKCSCGCGTPKTHIGFANGVCLISNGTLCEGNYREEDFEKAVDHLLRIYKGEFMKTAPDWIKKPFGYLVFERQLPSLTPELVTQFEYDTEWFPAKP